MNQAELLEKGGSWLGAVRDWIKWHCINGDRITWNSDEVLKPSLTVKKLEEIAACAVTAYINSSPKYDWIDCNQRLPNKSGYYLAWVVGEFVKAKSTSEPVVKYWNNPNQRWDVFPCFKVTHYMTIPTNPIH